MLHALSLREAEALRLLSSLSREDLLQSCEQSCADSGSAGVLSGPLGLVQLFVGYCRAGFEEVDEEGCWPADLASQEVNRFLATVDWASPGANERADSNPFLKKSSSVQQPSRPARHPTNFGQ